MLKSLRTLPHIAAQHYKITPKGGGVTNLNFTQIQLRMHAVIEMLLEKRKKAHVPIVKPRQIMATTFCNALEFKLSNDIAGLKTLVLSHRSKVSTEIFENLKRFQEQMLKEIAVDTTQSNDYKLSWKNLSELMVGVAGTDSARGFPCLILQLSELGRCKDRHVKDIQEGAMNAHASAEPGNMILVDSTSGGEGNYFHEIAKSGYKNSTSPWFTLFFGWWEMPEYRMDPPKTWVPDSDEVRVMAAINAELEKRGSPQRIDLAQMYWRHVKLHHHMRGNLSGFMREYPAFFEEAFQSAEGKLIDSVVLNNAVMSLTEVNFHDAKILGVDPAGKGDRTAIVKRQGFVIPKHWVYNKMDDVTLAHIVKRIIDEDRIDYVFIDMGYGHGTYNILRSLGYGHIVRGVHFGGNPEPRNKQLYFNKRAEMAGRFQDWMEEGPDSMGGLSRIPDDEDFLRDIRLVPDLDYCGQTQKFKLATKEEIKELLGKSPDIFDAAILTFAEENLRSRNIIWMPNSGASFEQQQSMLSVENDFRKWGAEANPQQNPNFKYYSFGGS